MKNLIFKLSVLAVFCLFASVSFGHPGRLGAAEIVAAYRSAIQNSLLHTQKSAFRAERKLTPEGAVYGPLSYETAIPYEIVIKYTVFHDRDRLDVQTQQTQFFKDEQNVWGKTSIDHKFQYLLDNKTAVWYKNVVGYKPQYMVTFTKNSWIRALGSLDTVGMMLEGYDDQAKPLWEILQEDTSSLHLRDSMELVGEHKSYVLEADTNYGHYTLWIDPNCGFNTRRVIVHRTGDDLMNGKQLSSPPPKLPTGAKPAYPWVPLSEYLLVLNSVKIENISGVFLPVEGAINITRIYSNGEKITKKETYKRTNIDLNPDFAAIPEAFTLDVPDGTRVYVKEFPGIHYVWQNGKIVPADDPTFEEIDKIVEELKKEQQ